MLPRVLLLFFALAGCTPGDPADPADADPCTGPDALLACGVPTLAPEAYVATAQAYFDTMDRRVEDPPWPPYSERVARWEWPPWLKLTAYTRANILATDTALRAYPSVVTERDCRAFDTQPFARCRVVFVYDERPASPCPIYEEFVFNEAGEVTWIEAWSDLPGLGPVDLAADPWAEGEGATRLSARIPGLGERERVDRAVRSGDDRCGGERPGCGRLRAAHGGLGGDLGRGARRGGGVHVGGRLRWVSVRARSSRSRGTSSRSRCARRCSGARSSCTACSRRRRSARWASSGR